MNDLTVLLGFIFCSSILIIAMLVVLYLIRKVSLRIDTTIKKIDAVQRKLIEIKFR